MLIEVVVETVWVMRECFSLQSRETYQHAALVPSLSSQPQIDFAPVLPEFIFHVVCPSSFPVIIDRSLDYTKAKP